MDNYTKNHIKYQVDWVLKELEVMITTGPRYGTDIENLDEKSDVMAVSIINPILKEAILKLERIREEIHGQNSDRFFREKNIKQHTRSITSDRNNDGTGEGRFGGDKGVISSDRQIFDITS